MIKKITIDFITGTLTYPVIHSFIWYKNGVEVTGTTTVVSTKEFNYDINGEVLNYTTPQNAATNYKFENIMINGTPIFYWAANNPTCNITIILPDNFDWDKFRIKPNNNNNSTRYYCKELDVHYFDENDVEIYTDIKKRPDELTAAQFDNTFVMDFNNPSKYYLKTPYNKIEMILNTSTSYSAGMSKLELYYDGIKLEGTPIRVVGQGARYVLNDGREIYLSSNSNYQNYYVDFIFNQTGYGFVGSDSSTLRPLKLYLNWFDDSILIDKLKFQISANGNNENRTISSYIFNYVYRETGNVYKTSTWINTGELYTYIREESFYIHQYFIEDEDKRYIYHFNKLEDATGTEKIFTDINNLNKTLVSTLISPKIKCKYPFNIEINQSYNKWFKYKESIKAKDLKNISNFTSISDFKSNYYGLYFAFVHNGNFLTTKMNPLKFDVNDNTFTEYQFLIDNVANVGNLKSIVTYLKNYVKTLEDNEDLEIWFYIYNVDKTVNSCYIKTFEIVKSVYDLFKPDSSLSCRVRKDCINIFPTTANTYRLNWYEEQSTDIKNDPKPLRTIKIYTYNTYESYGCCIYGLGFDDYILEITNANGSGTTYIGNITLTKGDEIITGRITAINANKNALTTIINNTSSGYMTDSPKGAGLLLVIELDSDITFRYLKISNYYSASIYNSNIIVDGYNSNNVLEVQKLICEEILGNSTNYQELYDVWN